MESPARVRMPIQFHLNYLLQPMPIRTNFHTSTFHSKMSQLYYGMGPVPGRRRPRSAQTSYSVSDGSELPSVQTSHLAVRKRRKRRSQRSFHRLYPLMLLGWVVGALFFCGILIRTLIFARSNNFQVLWLKSYAAIEKHSNLYNVTYTLAMERRKPPDQIAFPTVPSRPYNLQSTYGSSVKECSITIVVMEDKLSHPQ